MHVCVEWDSVKALVLVELLGDEDPRSRPFKLGHKETLIFLNRVYLHVSV